MEESVKALKSHLFMALLWVSIVLTAASQAPGQVNWRCAFNPSICGGPAEPPERKELCDQEVPDLFVMLYGAPPAKPGCLSVPEKVTYFTELKTFVRGSEQPFSGEAVEVFEEHGFGPGVKFQKRWGDLVMDFVGFPQTEWGRPVVVNGFAETYPTPFIARAQTKAIRAGFCVAKPIAQVPPVVIENAENCSSSR